MSKSNTLAVLCMAAAVLMVGVGMVVTILPQRVYAVSGSLEDVSLIASLFAVAYLLALLPIGFLADLLGAKAFLVLGYILCGSAGVVFFTAQGERNAYYLGRVIQGLGEAPIWALGPAILSLAYPHAKGKAIGIYNAAIHGGLMLGPLLALAIAPDGQSNLPFLVFGVLCFACALLVFMFLPDNSTQNHARARSVPSPRQFMRLLGQNRAMTVLAGVFLYGACYGSFVSVLPVSLNIANDFDTQAVGILFVVFYTAIAVSQLAVGPISDKVGRGGFIWGGLFLAALGFGTFLTTTGYWAYGPIALASLGLGVFCVASLAELNDIVPPQLKGTLSGAYYFAWGLGYVLGPISISHLSTHGLGFGYGMLAGALLIQAWILRRRSQKRFGTQH